MTSVAEAAQEGFNQAATVYEKFTGGSTRELAQHLLTRLPAIQSSSVVLDNACGTGIVTDEVLKLCKKAGDEAPKIVAADFAPNMVDILLSKFADQSQVECHVMSGEELKFPDNTFDISITNLGILFFTDGDKGASEIWRTLKPGGSAAVTSWSELGYLPPLKRAIASLRPDAPPFEVPILPHWYQPSHMEQTMRNGGFHDVSVNEVIVQYAGEDNKAIAAAISTFTTAMLKGWLEEDRVKLLEALEREVALAAKPFKRWDGSDALGLDMKAIVAICRK
jgi:ubiquinone/menaquinone biosynthesis C-methylase UbiE